MNISLMLQIFQTPAFFVLTLAVLLSALGFVVLVFGWSAKHVRISISSSSNGSIEFDIELKGKGKKKKHK